MLQASHRTDALLALAVAAVVLVLAQTRLLSDVERRAGDLLLTLKTQLNPCPAAAPITLVEIDDVSLEQVGRWPWRRGVTGLLVEQLAHLGARAVFLDIEFPELSPRDPGQPDQDREFARCLGAARFLGTPVFGVAYIAGAAAAGVGDEAFDARDRAALDVALEVMPRTEADVPAGKVDPPGGDPGEMRRRIVDLARIARVVARLPTAGALEVVEAEPGVRGLTLPPLPTAAAKEPLPRLYAIALDEYRQDPGVSPEDFVERIRGWLVGGGSHRRWARPRSNGKGPDPGASAPQRGRQGTPSPSRDRPRPKRPFLGGDLERLLVFLREAERGGPSRLRWIEAGVRQARRELLERAVLAQPAGWESQDPSAVASAVVDRLGFRHAVPPEDLAGRVAQLQSARLVAARHVLPAPVPPGLHPRGHMAPPIPHVLEKYEGLGTSSIVVDPDGVLRSAPLLFLPQPALPRGEAGLVGQAIVPLVAHLMDLDLARASIRPGREIVIPVRRDAGPPLRIPCGPSMEALVNFAGRWPGREEGGGVASAPEDPFARVVAAEVIGLGSARDVLRDLVKEQQSVIGHETAIPPPEGNQPVVAHIHRGFDSLPGRLWQARHTLVEGGARPDGPAAPLYDLTSPSLTDLLGETIDVSARRSPREWVRTIDAALAERADFVLRGMGIGLGRDDAALRDPLSFVRGSWRLMARQYRSSPAGLIPVPGIPPALLLLIKAFRNIHENSNRYDRFAIHLPRTVERLLPRVKDRICLVGMTASGGTDFSPIPLQRRYPNVGLHANLVNMLVARQTLRPVGWLAPVLCLALVLVLTAALAGLSILAGSAVAFLLVAAHVGAAIAALVYGNLVLPVVGPALAIAFSYLVITTRRWFLERRQKDMIRKDFEDYLDPRLVTQLLDNREALVALAGTTRSITAFFSDVQSFTSISEALSVEELGDALNEYLDAMTDVIVARGGMREKNIGDAIAAFFGAPLPYDDHASKACTAALEQQVVLEEIKRRWVADGVAWFSRIRARGLDMRVRIGLNTGPAKVGRFGGKGTRQYTMIGDTVNLAARLEGANKKYGTYLLASEATYLEARDLIEAREVDRIKVKGKETAVAIYEVMARKGDLSRPQALLLERYNEALATFRARGWDEARRLFEAIRRDHPDDGPTIELLHRLDDARWIQGIPEDWDGSYTMTEK